MVGGAKKSYTTSAAGNTQQPISARTDQQNGLPHDSLNAAQSQGSNHPQRPTDQSEVSRLAGPLPYGRRQDEHAWRAR